MVYVNRGNTKIIATNGTTISVEDGSVFGTDFTTPIRVVKYRPVQFPYQDDPMYEILDIVSRNGNVLEVVRAKEDTTATEIPDGNEDFRLFAVATKETFDKIKEDITNIKRQIQQPSILTTETETTLNALSVADNNIKDGTIAITIDELKFFIAEVDESDVITWTEIEDESLIGATYNSTREIITFERKDGIPFNLPIPSKQSGATPEQLENINNLIAMTQNRILYVGRFETELQSEKTYKKGQSVYYNGDFYEALTDISYGAGSIVGIHLPPFDTTNWKPITTLRTQLKGLLPDTITEDRVFVLGDQVVRIVNGIERFYLYVGIVENGALLNEIIYNAGTIPAESLPENNGSWLEMRQFATPEQLEELRNAFSEITSQINTHTKKATEFTRPSDVANGGIGADSQELTDLSGRTWKTKLVPPNIPRGNILYIRVPIGTSPADVRVLFVSGLRSALPQVYFYLNNSTYFTQLESDDTYDYYRTTSTLGLESRIEIETREPADEKFTWEGHILVVELLRTLNLLDDTQLKTLQATLGITKEVEKFTAEVIPDAGEDETSQNRHTLKINLPAGKTLADYREIVGSIKLIGIDATSNADNYHITAGRLLRFSSYASGQGVSTNDAIVNFKLDLIPILNSTQKEFIVNNFAGILYGVGLVIVKPNKIDTNGVKTRIISATDTSINVEFFAKGGTSTTARKQLVCNLFKNRKNR